MAFVHSGMVRSEDAVSAKGHAMQFIKEHTGSSPIIQIENLATIPDTSPTYPQSSLLMNAETNESYGTIDPDYLAKK